MEFFQSVHQLVILFQRLAEAEARVKDDIAGAGGTEDGQLPVEELEDSLPKVSGNGLQLHLCGFGGGVQEIQDQYTFEYRTPQQMDDSVLYAEPTLQGNAVITRRQEGDAETQVNLELLFNYKTQTKA